MDLFIISVDVHDHRETRLSARTRTHIALISPFVKPSVVLPQQLVVGGSFLCSAVP